MPIRVVRVLEYEFSSLGKFGQSVAGMAVPPNGVRQFGTSRTDTALVTVRSAMTLPEEIEKSVLEITTDTPDMLIERWDLDPAQQVGHREQVALGWMVRHAFEAGYNEAMKERPVWR